MDQTHYTFCPTDSEALCGYNRLYIEAFVEAMNLRDFVRHDNKGGPPDTQGWSYGLDPHYHDGRVTTRRTSWVFAKKEASDYTGAVATVYMKFQNGTRPVGYLVRAAPGSELVRI